MQRSVTVTGGTTALEYFKAGHRKLAERDYRDAVDYFEKVSRH